MSLTYAIAKEAPVGVVIAAYSGRLSRMYKWDLDTDQFTPGQFLKGRATVEDISPDGRYVAYYAESFHRSEQSYIAISHVPYFTALAFFLTWSICTRHARFQSNERLSLGTSGRDGSGWVQDHRKIENRVDPGCPFEIVREASAPWRKSENRTEDLPRNRLISVSQSQLFATNTTTLARRLLATFFREPFEEITPPEWARKW